MLWGAKKMELIAYIFKKALTFLLCWVRNKASLEINLVEIYFVFQILRPDGSGGFIYKNIDFENAESIKCEAIVELYNKGAEEKKAIKDVSLIIESNNREKESLIFSLNSLYKNGEEIKRSEVNNELVNIITIPPKELVKLRLKGHIAAVKKKLIKEHGISINFKYEDYKGQKEIVPLKEMTFKEVVQ